MEDQQIKKAGHFCRCRKHVSTDLDELSSLFVQIFNKVYFEV